MVTSQLGRGNRIEASACMLAKRRQIYARSCEWWERRSRDARAGRGVTCSSLVTDTFL